MTRKEVELQVLFTRLLATPFPSASDDLSVLDIHADLAELDGHISGMVQSALSGSEVLARNPEVDTRELEIRIRALSDNADPSVQFSARLHLSYLALLQELLKEVREFLDR